MVQCVVPYLSEFMDKAAAQKVSNEFLDKSYQVTQEKAHDEVEEEEGIDLCDCEFSLAYGAKILLNNTRLRLKKGRRYGLCGPNGAGKVCTSLFPPPAPQAFLPCPTPSAGAGLSACLDLQILAPARQCALSVLLCKSWPHRS